MSAPLIQSFEAWKHFVTHELVETRHETGELDSIGCSTVDRYIGGECELHVHVKVRSRLKDLESRQFTAVFEWPVVDNGSPSERAGCVDDVQTRLHHAASDEAGGAMLVVIPEPVQDPQFGLGRFGRIPLVRLYGFNGFLCWVREIFDLPFAVHKESLGRCDRKACAVVGGIRGRTSNSEGPCEVVQRRAQVVDAVPRDEADLAARLLADARTPNWLAGLRIGISPISIWATCVETAHFRIEGLNVFPCPRKAATWGFQQILDGSTLQER